MSKLSRRSLLKAAPAAVAAVPMTASALACETGGGLSGVSSGVALNSAFNSSDRMPEDFARSRVKQLSARRAKVKKAIQANRYYQRHAEAARLDSLRSISPTARMQLMADYDRALQLEQELSWISHELAEIAEQHPVLAMMQEALS